MNHLDIATAFFNHEIDDVDFFITLPNRLLECLNVPEIIVRYRKALSNLEQLPQQLNHNINTFLLALEFTQSSAYCNHQIRIISILTHWYIQNTSILYLYAASNVVTNVNVKLFKNYNLINHFVSYLFLSIRIHSQDTEISFRLTDMMTRILKPLGVEHILCIVTPIHCNIQLEMAEDQRVK